MVVFGGLSEETLQPLASSLVVEVGGDFTTESSMWATCQQMEVEGRQPRPRLNHSALWMEDLRAMLVYGGRGSPLDTGGDSVMADTWLLEVSRRDGEELRGFWREVGAADVGAPDPGGRCSFACCDVSGRSFFVHGGHNGKVSSGHMNDAWLCRIDDGFDELDLLGDDDLGLAWPSLAASAAKPAPPPFGLPAVQLGRTPSTPQLGPASRQSTGSPRLSRQESEQLTRQVSDAWHRLAPQVSVGISLSDVASAGSAPDDGLLVTRTWWRVSPDGPQPPRCCGHAAVRCGDSIIIHGGWSLQPFTYELRPLSSLRAIAEGRGAPVVGLHYTEVLLPSLSVSRPYATLHCVAELPVLTGGWSDASPEGPTGQGGTVQRAWHASCRLPVSEKFGPLVVVFGGRRPGNGTCQELLVLGWCTD
jgi:hypothetical protein